MDDGVNIYPEGVVDVDAIPSPFIEIVSLTIVEEQEQQILKTEEMEVKPRDGVQNHTT
jgi:hypothetical protein